MSSSSSHPLPDLSNEDIDRYEKNNSYYGGCYMRNNLPTLLRSKFYIVNLDSTKGPGTHWVLLYAVRPTEIYYFDPMGIPYPPKEVLERMKASKKKSDFNNSDVQTLRSESCGYFCMMLADMLMQEPTKPFKDVVDSHFKSSSLQDRKNNEGVLKRYFAHTLLPHLTAWVNHK